MNISYPCALGLSSVSVYNRLDCCGWRILDYQMRFWGTEIATAYVYDFATNQEIYYISTGLTVQDCNYPLITFSQIDMSVLASTFEMHVQFVLIIG